MQFNFKQFSIRQEKSAMKVGTDGVLLGAWAPVEHRPFSVLDIGAGTGLVAMMIAQRCEADQIDALEIDDAAFEECVANFENSKWADRLFCYHAGLDEFIEEPEDDYDLIVSNPPFFTEDVPSGHQARDTARQTSAMPFEQLVDAVALLLSENGIFAVIIPSRDEEHFIGLAKKRSLFPAKITRVKGTPSSKVIRSLIAFGRIASEPAINHIAIETARHQYTPEYIALTKNFYLKM